MEGTNYNLVTIHHASINEDLQNHKFKKLAEAQAVPAFLSFIYRNTDFLKRQQYHIPRGYVFHYAGPAFTERQMQVVGLPHLGALRIFYHPLRIMSPENLY